MADGDRNFDKFELRLPNGRVIRQTFLTPGDVLVVDAYDETGTRQRSYHAGFHGHYSVWRNDQEIVRFE